jgi:hypothetical protein
MIVIECVILVSFDSYLERIDNKMNSNMEAILAAFKHVVGTTTTTTGGQQPTSSVASSTPDSRFPTGGTHEASGSEYLLNKPTPQQVSTLRLTDTLIQVGRCIKY